MTGRMRLVTAILSALSVIVAVFGGAATASSSSSCTVPVTRTNPRYYAANLNANSIIEYQDDADGNIGPIATIQGSLTGLNHPEGLAQDLAGDLFVANTNGNSITEYAHTAKGNVAPIATIQGSNTTLQGPLSVVLDASCDLFVVNLFGNSVLEFAPGATGNVAPIATIQGSNTGLGPAYGITLDVAGNLYLADYGSNSITEYAHGSSGNAHPIATLQGGATGLNFPTGIALTPAGNLVVANEGAQSLTEYAPGASGNATPIATVSGGQTGILDPFQLTLLPGGAAVIANARGNSLTAFARGATGNVKPTIAISGSDTQLNTPYGVLYGAPAPPSAPAVGQITPGFSAATVAFAAPDYAGGFPITAYTATAVDLTDPAHGGQTARGSGSPLTINGLNNGDTYTFAVTATNPIGTGPSSSQSAPVVLSPPSFVANTGGDSVTEYANGATGNVVPIITLQGAATKLSAPIGVALDRSNGHLFVANDGPGIGSVTEFADGASGNAPPLATIEGTDTGLNTPFAIAIDPATRHLFVANSGPGTGSVTEYAAGASGDAVPIATLAGADTGINTPFGLAVDPASGNLIVANAGSNTITEYASGAGGDASPITKIGGSDTGLDFPAGVAVDASGHLLVANESGNSVTVYASGASGDARPIATIEGTSTGLNLPGGLAIGATGNLLVANIGANAVTEYAPGTTGDVPPVATIAGAATGLDNPIGITTPGLAVPAAPPPRIKIVARRLNAPKHLAFGPGGRLFVAESGRGGSHCVRVARAHVCTGSTGAIARITHGRAATVLGGLPSTIERDTGDVSGPAGLAVRGGRIAVVFQDLLVRANGTTPLPRPARTIFGSLRILRAGSRAATVDIARFAARHPQKRSALGGVGGEAPWDSDPYDVTSYRGGYAVVDAAANSLLFVGPSGRIRLLARFPTRAETVPARALGNRRRITVRAQAVPTSVAVGPDGALYVGILRGVPSLPGTAVIYRIVPGHAARVWARGLTAVTAIAFDRQGRLLATELSVGGLLAPADVPGALVRISRDGRTVTTLDVPGLYDPTGVAVARGGAVYVANRGTRSATSSTPGEVLKITG